MTCPNGCASTVTQATVPIDILHTGTDAVQHVAEAKRCTCEQCGASWYEEAVWRVLPQKTKVPEPPLPDDPFC